jgi:hypothetical protein
MQKTRTAFGAVEKCSADQTLPAGICGPRKRQQRSQRPQPRAEWLARRKKENTTGNFSQMHYARQGVITEEMGYVAHKEKLTPELVRDEVARGRMIIPPTSTIPNSSRWRSAWPSLCKINANIGNSAVTSEVNEELKKLHTPCTTAPIPSWISPPAATFTKFAKPSCATRQCPSAPCRSMKPSRA